MPMTPETPTNPTILCPTCGTRLAEDAARCLVCGAEVGSADKPAKPAKAVQGSRMPEITLSLPAALGLLALFLSIGAVMVFFALRNQPEVVAAVPTTVTPTIESTPTVTPTEAPPTPTNSPMPTPTPVEYVVQPGDTCLGIAGLFEVSIMAITLENNLGSECFLSPGTTLYIPQPTATVTPLPTATLSSLQETEQACAKDTYIVQENDTLSSIAANYNISQSAIKEENGLVGDTVFLGQPLVIPLCMRATPIGPTATPTPLPPYPAPNLLLPADGAPFTISDDTITLQWASVGTLREGEAYVVTVEDVTEGQSRKLVRYVSDTKFIVPASFRSTDRNPHVFRWSIGTVRQSGTDSDGNPAWEPAGALSAQRVFTWSSAAPAATPGG
jgi:LysM repeat protein